MYQEAPNCGSIRDFPWARWLPGPERREREEGENEEIYNCVELGKKN